MAHAEVGWAACVCNWVSPGPASAEYALTNALNSLKDHPEARQKVGDPWGSLARGECYPGDRTPVCDLDHETGPHNTPTPVSFLICTLRM